MPLASTFALQFYGPACAAMVDAVGTGDMPTASANKLIRGALNVLGTGDAPTLRPYRMRDAGCSGAGEGVMVNAGARKKVRAGMEVYVSALSSDDVTGAVLEAKVEGNLSLKQVLRLLLSPLAGKATGGGTNTITFRDTLDTKDRIVATVDSSGNRSAVTLDAS